MAPNGRPSTLASVACSLCRKRKRKCDGEQPCGTCVKYKNFDKCEYPVDKDRRKWKYDSSYVDHLEVKSDLLANFVNELTKSNPQKAAEITSRLKLSIPQAPSVSADISDLKLQEIANPNALEEVTSTAWRVRQDRNGRTAFYGPISGRQQVMEDEELESTMQKEQNGKIDVFLVTKEFREQLFSIFELNFARYFYISLITLDEVRTWAFPNRDPSRQFLLCAIFAYSTTYTNMKNVSSSFLAELEAIALSACRNSLDEFVLQALLVLSCFELGMAFDSSSWLFNAMCASQTQYLGLHLGETSSGFISSNNAQSMVSSSPLRSATFWSVVMQDRLITSVLGRGSRIQYFRIMASFYSPKIADMNHPHYLSELVFSFHSKLWYIHDRSMGQIYSFKAHFLHKSHRLALLKQGVNSLELLMKSFPEQIQLANNNNDPRVLMLHLSYYVVLLLLHRPYLSSNPELVLKLSTAQCINASIVVDKFNRLHGFSSAPYFASYLILSCAMFELFLLSNKDDTVKAESHHRMDIFITALLEFGKVWRRGYKDLQVLATLATKWNVDNYFLKELTNMAQWSNNASSFKKVNDSFFDNDLVEETVNGLSQQFAGHSAEGWNPNFDVDVNFAQNGYFHPLSSDNANNNSGYNSNFKAEVDDSIPPFDFDQASAFRTESWN